MSITKRRVVESVLLVGVVLLAGCAGGAQSRPNGQYSELYDGKSELTFSTLMPLESAQEGVARGDRAYGEGKLDLAVFEYIRAAELDPESADTFYKIGAVNLHKNALNKAESAFRLSLARNPEHAGALHGLGLIFLQRRQYEQARETLVRAMTYDARRWESFNALGILADLRGDFVDAHSQYEAALRLSPRNAQVHNNLGYSHYLAGDLVKAEREYRVALNLEPGHERAWRNLGQLYARGGRYEDALDAFTHVMDKPAAYNTIGYICMSAGQYDRAETFFKMAARSSPSYHVAANDNLEQLRRLRGQMPRH